MSGSGSGTDWRPPNANEEGDGRKATPKGTGDATSPGTADDPCNIHETTPLNSPQRAVTSTLGAGAELTLSFQPGPPPQLLAMTESGEIAGSVTSASSTRIMECMRVRDRQYRAIVQNVRGAICVVSIRPA